jgi:hypothetical protein
MSKYIFRHIGEKEKMKRNSRGINSEGKLENIHIKEAYLMNFKVQ